MMARKKNDPLVYGPRPALLITDMKVAGPGRLALSFNDGSGGIADMSAIIHRAEAFAPLADPECFAAAEIVPPGPGVEWPGIADYSADSLKALIEAARDMTGAEFTAWLAEMNLSLADAAEVFGVTDRTISSYKTKSKLPMLVKAAVTAFSDHPAMLAGRLKVRRAGRPRKSA